MIISADAQKHLTNSTTLHGKNSQKISLRDNDHQCMKTVTYSKHVACLHSITTHLEHFHLIWGTKVPLLKLVSKIVPVY